MAEAQKESMEQKLGVNLGSMVLWANPVSIFQQALIVPWIH